MTESPRDGNPDNEENLRFALASLWSHLHMHDGHIYAILAFYGLVSGGFVYNLDKMVAVRGWSVGAAILIGGSVIVLLIRIRTLVNAIRGRILHFETRLKIGHILPACYGTSWLRTANLAIAIVLVFTFAISLMIWNYR
jgi:hypothetical protein